MEKNKRLDALTQELAAQYKAQLQQQAPVEGQVAMLKAHKQKMLMKLIAISAVGAVLLLALMYIGVAWYTRVSNTHAITFDVADYELAVNNNTDDEFIVNMYDYSNVQKKKAAPGTAGYIPLRMSARHSDIDVDYTVRLENQMLPEFREHLRFFYLVDSTGNPVVSNITYAAGSDEPIVSGGYFLENPDNLSSGYRKVYFPATKTESNDAAFVLNGNVTMDTEKMLYIYWEWYLDAEDANTNGGSANSIDVSDTAVKTWDDLDTDIGRFPAKYYDALFIRLICTGVQSEPLLTTRK